jgi:hypothetical protein
MLVERRTWRGWVSPICFGLAALGFSISLVMQDAIALVIVAPCLALFLIGLALRPKAEKVEGAIYSGSADMLDDQDKKLPGQLSFTANGLTWVPTRYSAVRGARQWSVADTHGLRLNLQRGPGLLDLILTAKTAAGEERRFLTHQRRGFRRAVEALSG